MLHVNDRETGYSSKRRRLVSIAAVFLCCCLSLFAQNTAGSITGVVLDSQGAVIPGAKVTALNQEENAVNATVLTNREGVFVFNPLKVATYTIKVEASGFKTFSQRNIVLNVQITNLASSTPGQGGGIFGFGALNVMRAGSPRVVQLGAKVYF